MGANIYVLLGCVPVDRSNEILLYEVLETVKEDVVVPRCKAVLAA